MTSVENFMTSVENNLEKNTLSNICERYPEYIRPGTYVRFFSVVFRRHTNFSLEIDYEMYKKRMAPHVEGIIKRALHPTRIKKWLELGYSIEDIENFI